MNERKNQPNILLITTDQQRFDTFGRFAPSFMRTPHLDMLARDGIVFTRAYADCPVCVPSRMAYLTGKSVFTHGMGTNHRTNLYVGEENTLPTLMREAGYQTYAIGKLHFDPQHIKHGFDETITLDDYHRWVKGHLDPLQARRSGLGENEMYATMNTLPENLTLTSWIAEKAAEWLKFRRDPTKPWFLWVSYSKPHPPLDPPEPYYSMYRNRDIPDPRMGDWADGKDEDKPMHLLRKQQASSVDRMSPELIREARAAYYGLITQIDYSLGRIIGAIQDQGTHEKYNANDDTLILFASDHGDHMGDHHMYAKDDFLEGSAHIPFILRLPRTWKDRAFGIENDALVCNQDILPTLVGAGGGRVPDAVEGQDLLAMLRGEEAPRDHLICGQGFNCERPDDIAWAGVTSGRWKYTHYYADGKEQLFDLDNDASELHNLADREEHQSQKNELRAVLEKRLGEQAPRFLRDGKLFHRNETPPDERKRRTMGFPGLHVDEHPNDVQH